MSRPLRIAVVTPILPVPQDRTRGRFIYETVRALSRMATVKTFLTQARYPRILSSTPDHKGGPREATPDIDVSSVSYPALPWLSRLTNGYVAGATLVKPLGDFEPDLVIGYWIYPEGAAAIHAARRLGKPVALGALGTDINDRHGVTAHLVRRALHRADKIVFVSQAMTEFAQTHFGVPPGLCATVVNGVNTAVFHPQDRPACRSELGLSPQTRSIVYVGRLIEAKGLLELLEAVQRLGQAEGPVQLTIIGNGELKSRLLERSRELGLQDRVRLTGGLLPQEVAVHVNAADVLTLPSWTEGYPNVLVESLACGCPVVATRVGGIPEIVRDDNGVLVQPRDATSLSAGLQQALARSWDRAEISRRMSRTWDDVARETLQACAQLIDESRRH